MHPDRAHYAAFHRRRHAALLRLLERHMPEPAARCLDIGGGGDIGGLADAVRGRHAETISAVDRPDDAAVARERGVDAHACDIDHEALPFEDAAFGLVIFASVIEHLYHPRFVLDEIARVTAPGGLLILEAPNAVALGRRIDALLGRNPFERFNRYNAGTGEAPMEYCAVFYTAEEASEYIAGTFEPLETRYAMHSPPMNPLKGALREAAFRLNPRLGDCFLVAARRR